ncbi:MULTISPECIES: hypothetical protein [Dethiosulfovibrio]|uniref:Cell division protein ZapB n=2 Tax=Dethiosulfovibrio TaxID=47054 RepID=A0ABS9ESH5_9BACT|nr:MULTISPECIES: hypothetical protein [Dethiosulfovibrio]MCF4114708.1 hypothetical protein [Dethiosulfovibrio russensis]MCF4143087.1 hypothetical protein [Dethiosulfovibrio marinus]MCF4145213.1 hypothetical protein [Dethiosulfovibrio acidaminovorans]
MRRFFGESFREMRRERDALRREVAMARELIVVQDRAFDRQQKKLERAIDENLSLKEDLAEIETRLGGIVGGEEAV